MHVERIAAGIPVGDCHCGCGEKTRVPSRSDARAGVVKGMPLRFLRGHNTRSSPVEYVVDKATGCWLWQRAKYGTGYGIVRSDGRMVHAHRVLYERHLGPIPAGLEIDHLCGVRACVNPEHLELTIHALHLAYHKQEASSLTWDDVRSIREAFKQGEPQRDLGARYGIAQPTLSDIITGITWKDRSYVPGRPAACDYCGGGFLAGRSNQRFCCSEHRVLSHNRRDRHAA